MPIVSDQYGFVVGVDTHAATHSFSILDCSTGLFTDEQTFPTTDAGLSRALAWVRRRTTTPDEVLFAIEGTGSYGSILANQAADTGYRVTEAPTPLRARSHGKTDQIDARAAASSTALMPTDRLRDARAGDTTTVLGVLLTARESMSQERTAHVNALTALARSHSLGIDARTALTPPQIATITTWRSREEPAAITIVRAEALRLARRIRALDKELSTNKATLTTHTNAAAPALMDEPGVGPVTAAIILTVFSYRGRIRNAAAFTKIAGTCPIPASSGKTSRHRLNRGGDRRLNKALHTITLTRMRTHPDTLAYIQRRTQDGKSRRDIQRILKNRIARHLFRILNHP